MRTFTLLGDFSTDDSSPEHGIVRVTPSTLPLISASDEAVISIPILGKVDGGKMEMKLPALGHYLESFSLQVYIKFNSGETIDLAISPQPADTEHNIHRFLTLA